MPLVSERRYGLFKMVSQGVALASRSSLNGVTRMR